MTIHAILCDLTDTLIASDYPQQQLLPYARQHLAEFIHRYQHDAEVQVYLNDVRGAIGWAEADTQTLSEVLVRWQEDGRPEPALQALQQLLWRAAYHNGDLHSQLYADAHQALQRWQQQGQKLYLFSPLPMAEQQLLLGHSQYGNLLPWLAGHFDQSSGPQQEPRSYKGIAATLELAPAQLLLISANVTALDAAAQVGLATWELRRDQQPACGRHPSSPDFHAIQLD
ncbi:acireductone synthase [Balneatrix alpica]|uniref:acireductone synthase n=1 Tax=Balneatrix alpica TaxID=75684 RepID=UPI00273962FF|nr:acireductone synthase [Balneatrix alpica]